jgi:hypothetical protein
MTWRFEIQLEYQGLAQNYTMNTGVCNSLVGRIQLSRAKVLRKARATRQLTAIALIVLLEPNW